MVSGNATVAQWRRIALEKQLHQARFPAGVGVPSAVSLLCVVVVGLLSVVYLAQPGRPAVPAALRDSQARLVEAVTRGPRASATGGTAAARTIADRYAKDPRHDAAALARYATTPPNTWLGVAVLDPASRTPIAAAGEPVQAATVPARVTGTSALAVLAADGTSRLLVTTPLTDGRVLALVKPLTIRPLRLDPSSRQSILLLTADGRVAYSQGTPVKDGDTDTEALVRAATRATHGSQTAAATGTGRRIGGQVRAPVATVAPVAGAGAYVASVVYAPLTGGGSPLLGAPFGAALVALALVGWLLIRGSLVRPVGRLLEHAKAAACGEPVYRTRRSRIRDVARVEAALDEPSALPARGGKRGRGLSARFGVATAALLLIAWAAGVTVTFAGGAVDVPTQITADTQNLVENAATTIRETLDGGLTRLNAFAASNAGKTDSDLNRALTSLARRDHRFRSVYVTDAAGNVVVRAGRQPLRPRAPLPAQSAIRLRDRGAVPTIYGHVRLAGDRNVVGEFDIRQLAALLHRVDGRLRVVDAKMRTIVDTAGFLAFSKIDDAPLRAAAAGALGNAPQARVVTIRGTRTVVAAWPVGGNGTAARLNWAVVAERAVSDYQLAGNQLRRGAWLVAFLAVSLAFVLLAWHHFVLLRPLRALAKAADRMAAGDYSSVISPVRQDEIGSIAACLEICRQTRAEGAARLAGAVRMRGPDNDFTLVMPSVGRPRRGDHTGRRRRSTSDVPGER